METDSVAEVTETSTEGLDFILPLSAECVHAKSFQSFPTLCEPMDCNLPGSSVHGILQVRILQWVAMPSSRGSSQTRGQTRVFYVSFIGRRVLYRPPGKPTDF